MNRKVLRLPLFAAAFLAGASVTDFLENRCQLALFQASSAVGPASCGAPAQKPILSAGAAVCVHGGFHMREIIINVKKRTKKCKNPLLFF